jgi:hypothetical protein
MRLLAIPHANVLGLILFFEKNKFVWGILKISHPTAKSHVRNGSHFGCMELLKSRNEKQFRCMPEA